MAKGSCAEFRSQPYRALDRSYTSRQEFDTLYTMAKDIIVMLQGLIDYLEASTKKGTKYFKREEAGSGPRYPQANP